MGLTASAKFKTILYIPPAYHSFLNGLLNARPAWLRYTMYDSSPHHYLHLGTGYEHSLQTLGGEKTKIIVKSKFYLEKGKRVSISGTVDKVSLCHLNWNYR